jgi:hypothetical protein
MAEELSIEYSPKWAPHVKGRYSPRVLDPETKLPEEQRVEARCTLCGDRYKNVCRQGMPRNYILKFASFHSHKAMANNPIKVGMDGRPIVIKKPVQK